MSPAHSEAAETSRAQDQRALILVVERNPASQLERYVLEHELFELHGISDEEVSNMSDNLILLRFTPTPQMERSIRIIKTRGSAHDNREYILEITDKGAHVKKAG